MFYPYRPIRDQILMIFDEFLIIFLAPVVLSPRLTCSSRQENPFWKKNCSFSTWMFQQQKSEQKSHKKWRRTRGCFLRVIVYEDTFRHRSKLTFHNCVKKIRNSKTLVILIKFYTVIYTSTLQFWGYSHGQNHQRYQNEHKCHFFI